MALKYLIEYPDIEDVIHRLEIYDDNYSGSGILVGGTVYFDHGSTENPLEAIRGHGLRVELEADSTLTFSDLYSEDQRTFPVIYKRNTVILFKGWLNPNGWYEDFVTDKYKVSFDCVDGLSFLSDLAFVDHSTGVNIVGIYTQLEILSLALIRTGLEQNINVDIQIFYTGLAETNNILENINARAVRFIKDDDNTVMSCEEVLRDLLEPYGACITSRHGEWYVYKPNQIAGSGTLSCHRYDYLGTALSPATSTLDISALLGSDVDSYGLFHVNANQKISKRNSIGIFRANYKYGDATSLLSNPFFQTTDGTTLTGWTIVTGTNLTLASAGGAGIVILCPTSNPTPAELLNATASGLSQEDVIQLKWSLNCTLPVGFGDIDWKYQIVSTNSADLSPKYFRGKSWGTDATVYSIEPNLLGGIINFQEDLPPLPQDGKIVIKIFDGQTNTAPVAFDLQIREMSFNIAPVEDDLDGEFHTVQRTDKPAREAKDVKEVFTADTESDKYVGTLYEADGTTPTATWFRSGISEALPILQIYGEEVLKLSSKIATIFSGSIYGYYPYLSRVTINNIDGVFMPIQWSYDTRNNITTATLIQIFDDELTDTLYEKTYDRGNVVKPTIRGTYYQIFPDPPVDITPPLQGTLNSIIET